MGKHGIMTSQDTKHKLVKNFLREDVIKIEMFNQLLWLRTVKKHKTCDCTRCYWNPIEKILFIGYEGIKYKSKRFVKDVPLSLLPEGWRVIIRNVWDDKCGYDYVTGKEYDWESKEWDKLEGFIFSKLEWCLSHKADLLETYGEAIKRLFEKGYLEAEHNYLEWVQYHEKDLAKRRGKNEKEKSN